MNFSGALVLSARRHEYAHMMQVSMFSEYGSTFCGERPCVNAWKTRLLPRTDCLFANRLRAHSNAWVMMLCFARGRLGADIPPPTLCGGCASDVCALAARTRPNRANPSPRPLVAHPSAYPP